MKKINSLRLRIFSIMMLFATLATFSVNAQTVPNLGDAPFIVKVNDLELKLRVTSNTKENIYEVEVLQHNEGEAKGDIVIPETVSYAGKEWTIKALYSNSFYNNDNITSVTLPNSVITIGSGSFANCDVLTKVHFGAGVKTLKEGADIFYRSNSMTTVTVDENNPNFSAENGILLSKDKTTIIYFPAGKTDDYKIPANVTTLGDYSFQSTQLNSITLPKTLKKLGNGVFFKTQIKNIISEIEDLSSVNFGAALFGSVDVSKIKLTVPKGKIEDYKASSSFTGFTNIEEATDAAVNDIVLRNPVRVIGKDIQVSEVEGQQVRLFNLAGKVIFSANAISNTLTITAPNQGVYILQVNKQARKVLVK